MKSPIFRHLNHSNFVQFCVVRLEDIFSKLHLFISHYHSLLCETRLSLLHSLVSSCLPLLSTANRGLGANPYLWHTVGSFDTWLHKVDCNLVKQRFNWLRPKEEELMLTLFYCNLTRMDLSESHSKLLSTVQLLCRFATSLARLLSALNIFSVALI